MPLNKSQVMRTDRPFAKALIGNPEIADILPLSDQSLYVLGKKMGTTSLTLYDRQNMLIAVIDIAVGPDVTGLKRQIVRTDARRPGRRAHRRMIRSSSKAWSAAVPPPTARSRSPKPMRRARSSTCCRSDRRSR